MAGCTEPAGVPKNTIPNKQNLPFKTKSTSTVAKKVSIRDLFSQEQQDILLEILDQNEYKQFEHSINKLKWFNDKPYLKIAADIPGKYYCAADNSFALLEGDNGFVYFYGPKIGYRTNDPNAMFRAPALFKLNIPEEIKSSLEKTAENLVVKYNAGQTEEQQNSAKILNTYSILDYTVGCLDGDKSPELAIILENKNNLVTGSRQIYLLSKQGQDKYSIVNSNPHFVLGRDEGGVYGDPYLDITIRNRVLSINHYGGSNFRWGYTHDFAYSNKELRLIQSIENQLYTGTGNGTKTIYNYKDFSLKQYATFLEDDSKDKLIYNCPLARNSHLFKDFNWEETSKIVPSLSGLPDLGWYEYNTSKMIKTRANPNDILDLVKKSYYPDLEKVNFTWTAKTKQNYESVCFFKVADYYYTKNGATLEYWKVETTNTDGTQHIVTYSSNDLDTSDFYYYNDKTGKLIKQ